MTDTTETTVPETSVPETAARETTAAPAGQALPLKRPKIAVLLREDLLPWQELNVAAFLISGIAAARPDLMGAPYGDADGAHYLPLLGHPVSVLTASADQLAASRGRAIERGLAMSVYDAGMFATGNDADNRAVVAAKTGAELDLVGLAVVGERNPVDKVTKGAVLHP